MTDDVLHDCLFNYAMKSPYQIRISVSKHSINIISIIKIYMRIYDKTTIGKNWFIRLYA